ncbi:hypothetical protein [Dyella sp.]|uniref:hypothetical protein n=1 Tax=Dyella sp. TaxID=1869338 RepID=UPI002840EB10|nr:hypothetical protein [Dyella sp.]MDR3447521.1 hypothetical protein [Dyella sp.]
MLVDVYQSSTDAAWFVAVATGNPVAFASIPSDPVLVDPQLFLQGADLASSNEFIGLDTAAVVKQVEDKGFALFKSHLR